MTLIRTAIYFGLILSVLALTSCSTSAPTPDWQLNAQQSSERSVLAYLEGNNRVDSAESTRAAREVARTGRADLLARLALRHCAAAIASLDLAPCNRFEALRQDAAAPELAYADYLAGTITNTAPGQIALLPSQHQAVAQSTSDQAANDAVASIKDPLAKLVAAGVVFKRNQASPRLVDLAIDTASQQGWRRPLLAWLSIKLKRLQAQNTVASSTQIEQIKRRIAIVEETGSVTVR